MRVQLRETMYGETLDAMNFLNEVVMRYPEAISFAPGRPLESFFDVDQSLNQISRFVDHGAEKSFVSKKSFRNALGQYGRTNGQIHESISRYLEKDEGLKTDPRAVMVTCGCQEAMAILLMGLFNPGKDVLLVSDPSYIGITGLAQILGIALFPVPAGDAGTEPATLEEAIRAVRSAGGNAKAFYDIPDFNNPLGTSLTLETRQRILEIAEREKMLLFEDNPYGRFSYDAPPMPTLKSLDKAGVVIYMGTFSKTLFPGLRLGYLLADQEVRTARGDTRLLSQELSKVKSFLSINTSPLLQAIVGGILLENDFSLMSLLPLKLAFYKENRDSMAACLERYCGEAALGTNQVSWNLPGGGFFLTLNLPFHFDRECQRACAEEHGVICCPMTLFSLTKGHEHQIRLSFSYVQKDQIDKGIQRLAEFFKSRL